MKEHIVYFLGAGFSAPLGIPVVRKFLSKAGDAYNRDPAAVASYPDIERAISDLAMAKEVYETNLRDIEVVLSLFEMQDHLGGTDRLSDFRSFIREVITYYTPSLEYSGTQPWSEWMFGDQRWKPFGYFMIGMLQPRVLESRSTVKSIPIPSFTYSNTSQYSYSVISLNYDLILENLAKYINSYGWSNPKIVIHQQEQPPSDGARAVLPLAKLHGSIDPLTIVPPTWNKGRHQEVIPAWKLAYQLLMQASEIRFVGYSLPEGDAYAQYLLRAAATKAKRLRQIDVICLDPDGSVKGRFDSLCCFKELRCVSGSTEDYLKKIHGHVASHGISGGWDAANALEEVHQSFMSRGS